MFDYFKFESYIIISPPNYEYFFRFVNIMEFINKKRNLNLKKSLKFYNPNKNNYILFKHIIIYG